MSREYGELCALVDQLLEEVDELQRIVVALATTKRPNAGLSFVSDHEYTRFPEVDLVEHLRKTLEQRDSEDDPKS